MDKVYQSPTTPFSCDSDSNDSLAATPTVSTSCGNTKSETKSPSVKSESDKSSEKHSESRHESSEKHSESRRESSESRHESKHDCDERTDSRIQSADSCSKESTSCTHDKSESCASCKVSSTCDECIDSSTHTNSCQDCDVTSDVNDCNSCNTPTNYYPSEYCSSSIEPREAIRTPSFPISVSTNCVNLDGSNVFEQNNGCGRDNGLSEEINCSNCKPCDRILREGEYSSHFGFCTEASGFAAFAEGCNTSAQGACSHAEGRETVASDTASHAEGYRTLAWGKAAHAEGCYSEARGNCSHAEGGIDRVGGIEFNAPLAVGENSHAEGNATIAYGKASHVEGSAYYITFPGGAAATIFGPRTGSNIGPCPTDDPNGWGAHAEGQSTWAPGRAAHAEGGPEITFGGVNNIQFILGPIASGDLSHAEGLGTVASGYAAHAEGIGSQSIGLACHTEGVNTVANGFFNHIEGSNGYVNGFESHVEGNANRTLPDLAGQHLTGFDGVFATDPRPEVGFDHNSYNYSNQLASGQPGVGYPGEGISVIHKVATNGVVYNQEETSPFTNGTYATNGIYPLGQQAAYRTLADGRNYAVLLEDAGTLPDDPIGLFVSFDIYNANGCVGRIVPAEKTEHVIGVITGEAGFIANAGEFPASERIEYDEYHRPVVRDSCALSAVHHLSLLSIPITPAMRAELKTDDNTIHRRLAEHVKDAGKKIRFLALASDASVELKGQAAELRQKEKATAKHEPVMQTSVTVFDPSTGKKTEVEIKDLVHRKKEATILNERNMQARHRIEADACEYPATVTQVRNQNCAIDPCECVNREVPYVPRLLRSNPRWFQVATLGFVVARDNGECIPGHQCNVANGYAYPGTGYWVISRVDSNKITVWMR